MTLLSQPSVTRRQFIQTSAAALAAASTRPRLAHVAGSKPLPIGFSTLGCPAWDWLKILNFARQYGFSAVELRGLEGTMELPARPEFSPANLAQSKNDVASRGLQVACVSSSAQMHDADPQKHDQQLADARHFIDLASTLGAPYVRVFGNNFVGPRDQVVERVGTSLRQLGEYAGPRGVAVLIESHGDFIDSPTLRALFEKANSTHVGLLWDAHHTFVSGKEEPEFTVAQLGKYIRHTHLKDSRPQGSDIRYVLTGRGTVPVKRQVEALVRTGYRGYYSFEWEKVWHPEIEDPEIAIADYARVVSQYLKEAALTKS
jgi:sugar phosphate isomerase/epimerase